MAVLDHAEKVRMKNFGRPFAVLVLVAALLATTSVDASAATDPSSEWSEPSGGPSIVDGTGEQAEQGFLDPVDSPAATFSTQSTGDVVTISGAGNGHGIGMSQWGSQGRALAGESYDEILAAYYRGTTLSQDTLDEPLWVNLESELVKVYLKVEENVPGGAPVTVTRDDTVRLGTIEEITLQPGETLVVEYLDRNGPLFDDNRDPIDNPRRCTFASFADGDDPATATPTFASAEGSCVIDLNWDGWNGDPTTRIVIDKRWQYNTPASTGLDCIHRVGVTLDCAYARGTMHIRPDDYDEREPYDTGFHVVQELSLDDYARGIGEMPYSWDRDALKVQAVAGRTFARYLQQVYRADPIDRQWSWSSLYDRGPDQTYLGWGFDEVSEFGTYAANWVAAVDETAGQLLLDNGRYVSTNYSASNGGASENNEDIWGGTALSYLRSTPDPLDLIDANWAKSWTREIPVDYFAAKVGLDTVTAAKIVKKYVSGSPSDIAISGTLNGSAKTRHYTATQFMALFSGTSYRLYAPRILNVGVPTAAPPPPSPLEMIRLSGADRYETAVEISKDGYPSGAGNVFIATGENFPDALAVAPLAHQLGGPVLLTQTGSLPAATAGEIDRLNAKHIYILGGTVAISDAVEQTLAGYGAVTRLWGDDRYATAATISETAFPAGAAKAYVAVGSDFPDALSGAPIAAHRNGPLLLTRPDMLSAPTRAELQRLKPDTIIVVGGGTGISMAVVNALRPLADTLTIVTGQDRYATSAEVSEHAFPGGASTAYIARGTMYPDALAGGPAAADAPAPILLVQENTLPNAVAVELLRLSPNRVVILGGDAAVSPAVEQAILDLLG